MVFDMISKTLALNMSDLNFSVHGFSFILYIMSLFIVVYVSNFSVCGFSFILYIMALFIVVYVWSFREINEVFLCLYISWLYEK